MASLIQAVNEGRHSYPEVPTVLNGEPAGPSARYPTSMSACEARAISRA
jgi:hypothetical protein